MGGGLSSQGIRKQSWTQVIRERKAFVVLPAVLVVLFGVGALIQTAALLMVEGETAERSKALNDARVSLIQLIGLTGLIGGFVYSARTFALSRSTQRADRYAKAIGQLGDQSSEAIRVGGVHSLRLLAIEDSRYWPVVEQILSALVRERAKPGKPITTDIRAALLVIGQRPASDSKLHLPLDLRGVNLRGANLVGANFEGVWLDEAVLAGADLTDANLKNATLRNVNLEAANLSSANIAATDLSGAKLQRANFYETVMLDCDLSGAHLLGALNLNNGQLETTSGLPASLP